MTTGGWIFMSVSLLCVFSLVSWCYYKVLTVKHDIEKPPDSLGG